MASGVKSSGRTAVAMACGVMLVGFGVRPASAQAPTSHTTLPVLTRASMDDRGVVDVMHATNLAEAQLGALAARRAMNARVQRFAALMVSEHASADAALFDAQGKAPRWGLTGDVMAGVRFGSDSSAHMAHTGSIGTTGSAGYAGTGTSTSAANASTVSASTAATVAAVHAVPADTSGATGTMATSGSIGTTGSAGYANAGSSVGMSGAKGTGSDAITSGASAANELHRINAANMTMLSALEGPPFERAYIDNQVNAHAWALQNLDNVLIPAAKDPALQRALRQIRARVAQHLDAARDIQASIGH